MRFDNLIEGLQILGKDDMTQFTAGADHDIVWIRNAEFEANGEISEYGDAVYVDPTLTPEEHKRLDELGFHISDDCWAFFT